MRKNISLFYSVFFFFIFSCQLFSQDLNSIVTIKVNQWAKDELGNKTGGILEGVGTGTVIGKKEDSGEGYLGYVLTADHVVEDAFNIRLTFFDGKKSKDAIVLGEPVNRLLARKADVAILLAWVPKDVPITEIYDGDTPLGLEVTLVGKPEDFRKYSGILLRTFHDKIYIDQTVSPGDSGGPIYLGDKIVGVISGGWFWIEKEKDQPLKTWPSHGGGHKAIRRLMDSIK